MRGPEAGDRAREERRARGREGGEVQLPGAQAGQRGDGVLGRLEAGEERPCVVDERAARGGQPDAFRAAVEQPDADLALERDDRLRDGRRGVGERLGRGAQRPVVGDRAQHPQATDVEHAAELKPGV